MDEDILCPNCLHHLLWNAMVGFRRWTDPSMSPTGNDWDQRRSLKPLGRWRSMSTHPMVAMNSDFEELLSLFNGNGVRYLVVGGYAVMLYTEPRYTKDLDVWIEASQENAAVVFRAPAEFGAPYPVSPRKTLHSQASSISSACRPLGLTFDVHRRC